MTNSQLLEDAKLVVRAFGIGMSPQRYLAHTPDWLVRKLAEQVRTRRNPETTNE